MGQNPSRPPWVKPVLVASAVLVVLVVGYLVLVQPLRTIGTTAAATSTPVPGSAPPHAERGGALAPTVSGMASGATASAPAAPKSGNGAPRDANPSGVPIPTGDLPGWKLKFSDDFPGTALSPRWVAYTGQPSGDDGGYFLPSHVQVGGGQLTIRGQRDPAHGNIYVTGGVSNTSSDTQTYGRYEIRYRMEVGRGIAYALLLWPHTNQYPPEIDIAEDNGKDRRTLYGSLHPADGSTPLERSTSGDFTQWHTAGLEWSPGKLVLTVDGTVWGTFDGNVVPSQAMDLALQTQAWPCGHNWEACPDATTPPVVNLQIDWVAVYSRVG